MAEKEETPQDQLKSNPSSSDEDASEDEDMGSHDKEDMAAGVAEQYNDMIKNRREKRLAMNRASARARRKRKKALLDTLANQVTDVTKHNQAIKSNNDSLKARVEQLEAALAQANATIAALSTSRNQTIQLPRTLQTANPNVGSANQDALRSLLLGAVPSLNPGALSGANTGSGLGLGDQLLNARAAQLFEQQNQLKFLKASGLGGVQQQQQDTLESLGLSNLSSLLGQNRSQLGSGGLDFSAQNPTGMSGASAADNLASQLQQAAKKQKL